MAQQINLRPEDVDALGRIAYAEAGNQGPEGLAGVLFTVLNRLASNRWGSTISDVLNSQNQFEPVGRAGGDWRNLPRLSGDQQSTAAALLSMIGEGAIPDITGGATFFQNPAITQQRGTDFSAGQQGTRIGDHVFYDRYRGGAPVGVPAWTLAMSQGMAGFPPPGGGGNVYGDQGADTMAGGAGPDTLLPGQVPPSEYALSLPDLMAKLSGQGVQAFNFGGKAYEAEPGAAEPYRVSYDRFEGQRPQAAPGRAQAAPQMEGGPLPASPLIGGPIPSPLIGGALGQGQQPAAPITPTPNLPGAATGYAAAAGGNGMPPVTSRIMDQLFNAPPIPEVPIAGGAAPDVPIPGEGAQPLGYDSLDSAMPGLRPPGGWAQGFNQALMGGGAGSASAMPPGFGGGGGSGPGLESLFGDLARWAKRNNRPVNG